MIDRLRAARVIALARTKELRVERAALEAQRAMAVRIIPWRQARMKSARRMAVHSKAEWQAVVAFYGGKCLRCASDAVSKDHVVPVARGGSDGMANLQPLCGRCNTGKNARTMDCRWDNGEWLPIVALGMIVGE